MTFNSIREYSHKTNGETSSWKVEFSLGESAIGIVLDREAMERLKNDLVLTLENK
jgi:hypothetical protein